MCLSDPLSYVGWSLVLLVGSPMPNISKGRGQTKCDVPGPLGWGLGWGLITHSSKNKFITETEDIQIATNIGETTRAHSSRMTHLGQSRKETQKPTASIVNPKLETRI